MKIKMILIALTALLSLASCGDDDSGIQLTQDEIIGDINTGKKIVITSLTTYTESRGQSENSVVSNKPMHTVLLI